LRNLFSKISTFFYIINEFVQGTKNEPQQQGIFYLEREREGVKERGAGWVKFGRDREIEGRDRETER
jgi:hypothetical protein